MPQPLDHDVVADELRSLGIEPMRFEHIPSGRVNDNFALTVLGLPLVLRVWRLATHKEAQAELTALTRLAGVDFPGPRPIALGGLPTQFEIAGRPAACFEFIPSDGSLALTASEWSESRSRQARQVSTLIARINRVLQDLSDLELREESYATHFEKRAAKARATDLGPHAREVESVIIRIVELETQLSKMDLPVGLIHGDPGAWNMRFQDGNVVALLDFDMLHRDPLIFDIAHVVTQWGIIAIPRSGGGFWDVRWDPLLVREIVTAYKEVRPLTSDERSALLVAASYREAVDQLGAIPYITGDRPQLGETVRYMVDLLDRVDEPSLKALFV